MNEALFAAAWRRRVVRCAWFMYAKHLGRSQKRGGETLQYSSLSTTSTAPPQVIERHGQGKCAGRGRLFEGKYRYDSWRRVECRPTLAQPQLLQNLAILTCLKLSRTCANLGPARAKLGPNSDHLAPHSCQTWLQHGTTRARLGASCVF